MLLPFREHLDFGPTPYDLLQQKEGIPTVKGNVVEGRYDFGAGPLAAHGRSGCCC